MNVELIEPVEYRTTIRLRDCFDNSIGTLECRMDDNAEAVLTHYVPGGSLRVVLNYEQCEDLVDFLQHAMSVLEARND